MGAEAWKENAMEALDLIQSFMDGASGVESIGGATFSEFKSYIKDGSVSEDDCCNYIAKIIGAIVNNTLKFSEQDIIDSDAFSRYMTLLGYSDSINANNVGAYINTHMGEILPEITDEVSNISSGLDYYQYAKKLLNATNIEEAMEGFFGLADKLVSNIPVIGGLIALEMSFADWCFKNLFDVVKHEALVNGIIGEYASGTFSNIADYNGFNNEMDRVYGDIYGLEYIKMLHVDYSTIKDKILKLENNVGEDLELFTPIELVFLLVTSDRPNNRWDDYDLLDIYEGVGDRNIAAIGTYADAVDDMEQYIKDKTTEYKIYDQWNDMYISMRSMLLNCIGSIKWNNGVSNTTGNITVSQNNDSDVVITTNEQPKNSDKIIYSGYSNDANVNSGDTFKTQNNEATNYEGIFDTEYDHDTKCLGINQDSECLNGYGNTFNSAEEAQEYRRVDPLVFDLNRDGVFSTTVEDGVYFDYEADGFKEKTAWMSQGDGMLVRDISGNGMIDNGTELFGDQTLLSNGDVATNGIDALTDLDSNNDSVINSDDEFFSDLRIWADANRDGTIWNNGN